MSRLESDRCANGLEQTVALLTPRVRSLHLACSDVRACTYVGTSRRMLMRRFKCLKFHA